MKKKRKKVAKRVERLSTCANIKPVRTEWIKARRNRLGLTLAEISRRAGMNIIQWQKIESGKTVDPRMSTMMRMAMALRCNPMELLNWREWKKGGQA